MSDNNEEQEAKQPTSKINDLLAKNEKMNNSQINVYFSQNNWETNQKVEIVVEENTTVLQLIDSAVFKIKNELNVKDIEDKNYCLMMLKKKTQKPNYEYPICNPEALVLNYDKTNFCLVEKGSEENPDGNKDIKENKPEEKKEDPAKNNTEQKNENPQGNNQNNNDQKAKKVKKSCIIF